jgi:hypothetical protein
VKGGQWSCMCVVVAHWCSLRLQQRPLSFVHSIARCTAASGHRTGMWEPLLDCQGHFGYFIFSACAIAPGSLMRWSMSRTVTVAAFQ